MKYRIEDNIIIVDNTKDFDIKDILECGQVFRFKKTHFGYVVYSLCHKAEIHVQEVYTKIVCDDVKYFEKYFDFCTDYAKIKSALSEAGLTFVQSYSAFTKNPISDNDERIYIIARECGK